jgi:hypothetical protein
MGTDTIPTTLGPLEKISLPGIVQKQPQILHPLKRIQDDSAGDDIVSAGPRSPMHQKSVGQIVMIWPTIYSANE